MKTTFTSMMMIGMMFIGTTTGFAKTTVKNNNNTRPHTEMVAHNHGSNVHHNDRNHSCCDMHHHNGNVRHNPVERTMTVVEFRGRYEAPKLCSVCKHRLAKGERHTHIVKVVR